MMGGVVKKEGSKLKRIWLVVSLLVAGLGLWLISGCSQPAPAAPVAPAAPAAPVAEPKATAASLAKGGTIYDKWWKVAEGATAPTGDQSLWATQTTNTRKGTDTWRCKECHGWDYKGKDGAYGKGSHLTGFTGVYTAGTTKTKAQLMQIMKGSNNAQHNFSTVMGEAALQDVVNFLSEGLIDDTKYIDYATKKPIGANVANGNALYTSTCAACHGADGKQILFDGKDSLGFVANDNPWEVLHKIRFGQPGAPMPSGVVNGWSNQDAVDVLAHAQTLPK